MTHCAGAASVAFKTLHGCCRCGWAARKGLPATPLLLRPPGEPGGEQGRLVESRPLPEPRSYCVEDLQGCCAPAGKRDGPSKRAWCRGCCNELSLMSGGRVSDDARCREACKPCAQGLGSAARHDAAAGGRQSAITVRMARIGGLECLAGLAKRAPCGGGTTTLARALRVQAPAGGILESVGCRLCIGGPCGEAALALQLLPPAFPAGCRSGLRWPRRDLIPFNMRFVSFVTPQASRNSNPYANKQQQCYCPAPSQLPPPSRISSSRSTAACVSASGSSW